MTLALVTRRFASVASAAPRRTFASVSSVSYERKGEQPPAALPPVTHSSTTRGINCTTIDRHAPISSIALILHAGARDSLPGLAHIAKNAIVRTTQDTSIVRTLRDTELRGDALATALSREHLLIQSHFLRDNLQDAVSTLIHNLTNTSIAPYEFLDVCDQVALEADAALAQPALLANDLLHAVAFRRSGLAHSLYGEHKNTASLTRKHLLDFLKSNIAAGNVSLVGLNVAHKDLVHAIESALPQDLPTTPLSPRSLSYHGGEARLDTGATSKAEFMLAFPSTATASHLSVLQHLFAKDAFFHTYSDISLFGIHLSTRDIPSLHHNVQAFINVLKRIDALTDAEIQRANKLALLDHEANRSHQNLLAFLNNSPFQPVTKDQLVNVAQALLKNTPSVAAVGPVDMPYLDEFSF